MKLLLVTLYFPPSGGGGVQRSLKFASHLPALGIETHVLPAGISLGDGLQRGGCLGAGPAGGQSTTARHPAQ